MTGFPAHDRADDRADAGVFAPDERRAERRSRAARSTRSCSGVTSPAPSESARTSRSSDLGDADASAPARRSLRTNGSVAWFKSRDAMALVRARARGRRGGQGVGERRRPLARRVAGAKASPKKGERLEDGGRRGAWFGSRDAELSPIGANSTDSTGNGGARDKAGSHGATPRGARGRATASPPPRVQLVVPAGRASARAGSASRGAGRARACRSRLRVPRTRAVTWWTPRASTRTRVAGQTRTIWSCASTTQTTTTTTRTVTMDGRRERRGDAQAALNRTAGDVPSARAATTATDVAGFDALTLTEGQIDVVADLLERTTAWTSADECDLLARTRTRKKYRGVETREWDEREREAGRDDAETENDEGVVALVGNLLRGLLGGDDEKPRACATHCGACSATCVFDKPPTDPEARSRAVAAATAAIPASAGPPRGFSRAATRTAAGVARRVARRQNRRRPRRVGRFGSAAAPQVFAPRMRLGAASRPPPSGERPFWTARRR